MQAKVVKTCKKQARTQGKESKCNKKQAQTQGKESKCNKKQAQTKGEESKRKKKQAKTKLKESQRQMCTCGSGRRPSRCSNTPACLALAKDLCLWHMISQVKSRSCLGTHSHHNYSLRVALTPCSRCRCTQSCCFGKCGPANTAAAKKKMLSESAKSAPWFGEKTKVQFFPDDENSETASPRYDTSSIMYGISRAGELTRAANSEVTC
jgi:hypothetical protein